MKSAIQIKVELNWIGVQSKIFILCNSHHVESYNILLLLLLLMFFALENSIMPCNTLYMIMILLSLEIISYITLHCLWMVTHHTTTLLLTFTKITAVVRPCISKTSKMFFFYCSLLHVQQRAMWCSAVTVQPSKATNRRTKNQSLENCYVLVLFNAKIENSGGTSVS